MIISSSLLLAIVIYSLLSTTIGFKRTSSPFVISLVLAIAIQEDATTIGAINHVLFQRLYYLQSEEILD
jgi:hypothetical protein